MSEDVPLALYLPAGLFLKPDPKVTIEVKLPEMKQVGVSVSNWEVMEKIRVLSLPEIFASLRVLKYSRDVIHFEGELESSKSLRKVILLIDGKSIKLSGFSDMLKVKVRRKEMPHPSKQEWEDYFADRGMEVFDDERPGERPDTVHIRGLPIKWFVSRTSNGNPCPRVLTQAFQKFGRVREVGVYEPSSENKNFSSFGPGIRPTLHFEGFIQYDKYTAFCNAMQSLKGMKLIRLEEGGKEGTAIIQTDFDHSGFLTARNIRKRRRAEERRHRMEEEEERRKSEKQREEEEQQEEIKKKAEEEKARKKAEKQEAKQRKKDEQAKLVAELKAVAMSRREEAQRLLGVLLAGAAETK
jgi:arginine/serine-rich splicing factor 17